MKELARPNYIKIFEENFSKPEAMALWPPCVTLVLHSIISLPFK
jgi:hypothetical protein